MKTLHTSHTPPLSHTNAHTHYAQLPPIPQLPYTHRHTHTLLTDGQTHKQLSSPSQPCSQGAERHSVCAQKGGLVAGLATPEVPNKGGHCTPKKEARPFILGPRGQREGREMCYKGPILHHLCTPNSL